jgi:hypothetical protein
MESGDAWRWDKKFPVIIIECTVYLWCTQRCAMFYEASLYRGWIKCGLEMYAYLLDCTTPVLTCIEHSIFALQNTLETKICWLNPICCCVLLAHKFVWSCMEKTSILKNQQLVLSKVMKDITIELIFFKQKQLLLILSFITTTYKTLLYLHD